MTRPEGGGRWGNLWWEVIVGLLVVCGLLWLAWYAPEQLADQITGKTFGQWAMVLAAAAIGTAAAARFYWSLRRFAAFWGMALAFVAALAASAYLWFPEGATGAMARAIWFAPICGAEFALFAYLVYRKFHAVPKQKR